jgi:hypothetical protein
MRVTPHKNTTFPLFFQVFLIFLFKPPWKTRQKLLFYHQSNTSYPLHRFLLKVLFLSFKKQKK